MWSPGTLIQCYGVTCYSQNTFPIKYPRVAVKRTLSFRALLHGEDTDTRDMSCWYGSLTPFLNQWHSWWGMLCYESTKNPMDNDIKTCSGGVCCPNAWGPVRIRKSNPEGVSPRNLTYCSHKPECSGTTNSDRFVLIRIITWHFQFQPVNVSNLRVKGAYVLEAGAFSRAPPIVTSGSAPKRWELSPHNTRRQGMLCSLGAASRL